MAAISTSPEKKRERHGFRRRKTRTAAAIEYVMEVRSAARTPFNPWNIALSEILPAVGCHRLSHCGKALCDQILQLTGRRKSGNCLRAEQVNGSLHNHCTGCGDGKLECHRNAHRADGGNLPHEASSGVFPATYPAWSDKYKKTEHSRNSLGENGCISGSRNAHFKTNDEKQIQKNI